MYNSTLVAINGKNFEQIWNFTVPGPSPETNISPTPAYFNFDNVTDFLIIYQKYDDILNYNYTQVNIISKNNFYYNENCIFKYFQTFIIDGKSGESMYRPITGGVISQSSGLTVSSESYGYDMYLFWTSECTNLGNLKKLDETKGTIILKLIN